MVGWVLRFRFITLHSYPKEEAGGEVVSVSDTPDLCLKLSCIVYYTLCIIMYYVLSNVFFETHLIVLYLYELTTLPKAIPSDFCQTEKTD